MRVSRPDGGRKGCRSGVGDITDTSADSLQAVAAAVLSSALQLFPIREDSSLLFWHPEPPAAHSGRPPAARQFETNAKRSYKVSPASSSRQIQGQIKERQNMQRQRRRYTAKHMRVQRGGTAITAARALAGAPRAATAGTAAATAAATADAAAAATIAKTAA